ncbi:MAG: SGNH/GDSL hydrolase family protein [Terrimicrobiaceae bacterium]
MKVLSPLPLCQLSVAGWNSVNAAVAVDAQSSPQAVAPPEVAAPQTYLTGTSAELKLRWPANHTVNLVCHGHSVPAGYARTPEVRTFDAYPHLMHLGLNERYPHAVINVIVTAIGGENSEQGAARFEKDVLSLRPEVVTIDYGLNDRPIGLARAEKGWRSMIEAALAAHVKVLLLTPTGDLDAKLDDPDDPLNQHAAQIRRLAAEYHIGLVDSLAAFKNYAHEGGKPTDLMAQVNHPNHKGHELVAAELLKWFPLTN